MRQTAMRQTIRVLGLAACLAALPLLANCGFVPLYAQTGVTSGMAAIEVDAPQTRTGYFLEQDLRNGLETDASPNKLYTLKITMKEQHFAVGYQVDDTSLRSEITAQVSYNLIDKSTGKSLYKDNFSDTVTYDTTRSPFTGVVAQQDAQKRIATDISGKIQTALALYFHGDAPKAP
ncbi:MAG: LPS assembly lipoprotein LptE [Asticcacaulis sp.]|uniref:LPS assembly lipoprotein LptE n=1 Tax=Asticcacaulis sp. TaxID=1872648 RepID=UPI003F7C18E4